MVGCGAVVGVGAGVAAGTGVCVGLGVLVGGGDVGVGGMLAAAMVGMATPPGRMLTYSAEAQPNLPPGSSRLYHLPSPLTNQIVTIVSLAILPMRPYWVPGPARRLRSAVIRPWGRATEVLVGRGVDVEVGVEAAPGVPVGVRVGDGVAVGVGQGVPVGTTVRVAVAVLMGVGVFVGIDVFVAAVPVWPQARSKTDKKAMSGNRVGLLIASPQ